jgi:tetratricopeptide (TPR) repeat protein
MTPGDLATDISPQDPADLLPLALSRPHDALRGARALLAAGPGAFDASLAHHAIGIVLRDRGDLPAAVTELKTAARLARSCDDREREVEVESTLGVTLAWMGRSKLGLAVLDQAVQSSSGMQAGRILMRRASVLKELGRFDEAHRDLSRALPYFRRAGDTVWEPRALTWRAEANLGLGLIGRAAADYARAEELFATNGQELEYAKARHNRGLIALFRGDLPQALTYLDEAARRYSALNASNPDLDIDRCFALLAAGLAQEAAGEAASALDRTPAGGGIAYKRAELLLAAATASLAAGRQVSAIDQARQASRLFRAHGRSGWQARADLVRARAAFLAGDRSARLAQQVERIAAALDASRSDDELRAHLLAGRLAIERGRRSDADRHLDRAASFLRRPLPLTRSLAWLARALQAEAHGDRRGTRLACARGLEALDRHQLTQGAAELRAYGTAHGAELALLPQRLAVRDSDARGLLTWSERWRATVLGVRSQPGRPDRELQADLSALRSVTRLLARAESARSSRVVLDRERRRLEAAVQARTRRQQGGARRLAGQLDLDVLAAELGPRSLLELAEVDGLLYAIIMRGGRLRMHEVGPLPEREVDLCRFTLRMLAAGRDAVSQMAPVLAHRARKLEEALLGPAARDLGAGPVVVVPPGRLHAVPWALLPSLCDRVVSVAPSAASWVHARLARPPARRRTALVVGPDLATGGAEVEQIRSHYPGAVVLGHGGATVSNVLSALDGAWLAHLAAHGEFRADNPMFSSLQLDDGPLIVHDLDRLRRAPHQLVLSSCDSAVAAAVGADEVLGLASSLITLGAAGIVASVVPVNDLAAVPLMVALHDAVRAGASLPEALLAARQSAAADVVATATARSFVAIGA